MKVFISHQQNDSEIATQIYNKLRLHNVEAYLDVFDNALVSNSQALTEHLKSIVRKSSDILVVMSGSTKSSWWVPFEIGIAANQDLPTVTYLQDYITLPEYLDYWPRLKNLSDISKYVAARKNRLQEQNVRKNLDSSVEMFSYKPSTTEEFYKNLKAML